MRIEDETFILVSRVIASGIADYLLALRALLEFAN